MSDGERRQEILKALVPAESAVRRMVEDASADAVVILWSSQRGRATRVYRHQMGNDVLCDALVERIADDQRRKRMELDE